MPDRQSIMNRARQARDAGRPDDAGEILQAHLAGDPAFAPGWNFLGILKLDAGDAREAVQCLDKALHIDPAPPFGWFNLAQAQRALGDRSAELASLDEALSRDPYFLPALLAKGEVLRALRRDDDAFELYRLLFEGLQDTASFPPNVRSQLAEAKTWLGAAGARKVDEYARSLAEVARSFPDADLARARAYAENRAGTRKVYQQQPTGGHFPYLPAIEYFDPALFPWFGELEGHTAAIREELLSLWDDDPSFRPYVARAPGMPLDQWQELNHSPRWSAFFFWEDGVRNDANCARCPRTAAALEAIPLLDIPGKAPTAMYSLLKPRTRIPPHTGTTNARTTVHLPLVVPDGCGFRVGAETRQWREGECWAFDDTIEHEAWNDSDSPRAILILDAWNPLLSEAEREAVRALG